MHELYDIKFVIDKFWIEKKMYLPICKDVTSQYMEEDCYCTIIDCFGGIHHKLSGLSRVIARGCKRYITNYQVQVGLSPLGTRDTSQIIRSK
jgi:hypothetical protein